MKFRTHERTVNLTCPTRIHAARRRALVCLAITLMGSFPAQAEDGTELVVSNTTHTAKNILYIGKSGTNNSLLVTDAGILNCKVAYIGYGSYAHNNNAVVEGSGSSWFIQQNLSVGYRGSSNLVEVLDGAILSNAKGYLGNRTESTGNKLVVSGAGSTWTNRSSASIGYYGSGNSLIVTNGGSVYGTSIHLGHKKNSNGNEVLIDGTGSRLVATDNLYVGFRGSGNTLRASNGARIETLDAFLGRYAGSDSNTISLSNAKWSARNFSVGHLGNGNRFFLSDGAGVDTLNTYLGYDAGSNEIWIDGNGSTWTNYATFFVGYHSSSIGNVVHIDNGGSLFSAALAVRTGNSFVMNNGASALISGGTTASLSGGGMLVVGETQGGNTLAITAGGIVESGESILGLLAPATANSASVDGSGSQWNTTRLVIGDAGGDNSLSVSNGGSVSASKIILGNMASSGYNQITVTGARSQIISAGTLDIGLGGGRGNRLQLLAGGQAYAQTATIHSNAAVHLENGYLVANVGTLIKNGGTLSGWGQVSGSVTNLGLIDIGDAFHFETLAFGDSLVLADSSEIIFDIASLNAHDKVTVARNISYGGTLTVRLANGFTPQLGDTFDLFDWTTGVPGSFDTINLPAFSNPSLSWDTSMLSTDGSIEVVPEPVVAGLIGIAGSLLLVANRLFRRIDTAI
ncbi:MAG: hypothetical protein DRP64_10950 [Verrucomicrobia bacterium]|nr:MAG: hypothetical protein DRP64_10950 [Verrucomicrobiota bacterium]